MDLSESMAYTYRQQLNKFDYSICLAAALGYMMIHQQDPVGLLTFDKKIRQSLPARSKRTQLGNILALLSSLKPQGETDVAAALSQIASMLRHKSLIMLFSDLLTDPEPVIQSLHLLRHAGHDIILFHILDEAETQFPFKGAVDLKDPESGQNLIVDAEGMRSDYLEAVRDFCNQYRRECTKMGADYVELNTSMPFDKALLEYLSQRQARF